MRLFSFCRACSAWVDELIHPDARRSPTERVRHHDFLARQIIAAGTIIVGAPFWLMAFGAPTPAQGLIYFLAQTPLVSAIFLSSHGNLLVAQTLSIVGTLATAGAALMLADGTMPLAVALVAVSILEIIGAPRLAPLFLLVAGLAPAAAYAAGGGGRNRRLNIVADAGESIHGLRFWGRGRRFEFDDFAATLAPDISPDSGTVPEPASWAMRIAGFSLVGAVARRRGRRVEVMA